MNTWNMHDGLTEIRGTASQEGKEVMMRLSSADLLCDTAVECGLSMGPGSICLDELIFWMEKQPLQPTTLAIQVAWTTSMEGTLDCGGLPEVPLHTVGGHLPTAVKASDTPYVRASEHGISTSSGLQSFHVVFLGALLSAPSPLSLVSLDAIADDTTDVRPSELVLEFAEPIVHIVDFTTSCAPHMLLSILNQTAQNITEYPPPSFFRHPRRSVSMQNYGVPPTREPEPNFLPWLLRTPFVNFNI
ncbi:hypothetical protein EDD15DRAFT_2198463 [Pisolithus albus]|nr:hypothetical protein EDD15DRAFT_2198463 [Pisolithus albus]